MSKMSPAFTRLAIGSWRRRNPETPRDEDLKASQVSGENKSMKYAMTDDFTV
jgi:hypothetical protein